MFDSEILLFFNFTITTIKEINPTAPIFIKIAIIIFPKVVYLVEISFKEKPVVVVAEVEVNKVSIKFDVPIVEHGKYSIIAPTSIINKNPKTGIKDSLFRLNIMFPLPLYSIFEIYNIILF